MANCLTCIHQEVCKERMEIFNLPNIACQYEAHELVGEWKPYTTIDGYTKYATCTNCGFERKVGVGCSLDIDNLPKFCENCRAKMRKGEEK